ncbi:MAG: hypothetical protein CVU90_04770 [Firmicutes bacterium HGW-Firmicutes-15]|nr:MAG: hypothetical protein CVU90_04770 [Firmicutes bacterium HGW-Firmicutes-15]
MNDKPLIAVLSTVRINPNSGFPTGREARIYKEKFAAAKQYGIRMFLFFVDDVNWINRTIKGFAFVTSTDNKGHWVRKAFPFPDVVYNRIRYRKIEKQPKVKQLLKSFDNDPNIQLFNTRFLDKWEVHQSLINNPNTLKMVPPTRLFSSINLKEFLDKYSEVFIKPRNNNAGRGIVKVICDTSNIYTYGRSDTSPPKWRKSTSFSKLWNHLINEIRNPDDYLIQTGIDLCRLDGQVFDLRAQVQKDGNGKWVFTGVNVRAATGNRFVTYPKVGKRVSFDKAIDIVADGSEEFKCGINYQLSDLYHYVPMILEKDLGLSLGVLSIDIGIDIHGKTWLIEVSSKSDSFSEDNIRARHFKYLMEYFLYITGGNPGKNAR